MMLLRIMLFCIAMMQMHCINYTDTVTGSVVDGNIGLPIPEAEVRFELYDFADKKVSREDPIISTDMDGVYSWKNSETMILFQGGGGGLPDKAIITVTKAGYKPYKSAEFVKLSSNVVHNVKLVP